jgi:putative FmdB family regulatory protein
MPLYSYKCDCGYTETVLKTMEQASVPHLCKGCGKEAYRNYSDEKPGHRPFKAYFTEALTPGPHPIEVRTREQERALLKQTGFERVS